MEGGPTGADPSSSLGSTPYMIETVATVTRGVTRSPTTAVGESAAMHLEEWHSDWGYSKPIVALDIAWNMAFVLITGAALVATADEKPPTPIRAWVTGYAVQCLLHSVFVWVEYRRRRGREEQCRLIRVMKTLEPTNAVIAFLWWLLGFYWIVIGGQALLQDAHRLYWLTVVFLAFDVFFTVFCILLACLIGIALCCCMPCIIAILYAVARQEGTSDDEMNALPTFRFCQVDQSGMFNLGKEQVKPVTFFELNSQRADELTLSREDSSQECCICLSHYEDGVELRSLPCSHHFHTGCIGKWLRINATCPLCKCNILRGDERV